MPIQQPIAPNTKNFLNKSLPNGQGGHNIAIGEAHNDIIHAEWLRDHSSELLQQHNVGTAGFERSAIVNVFFWAYKDGHLPVPEEHKAKYMHSILDNFVDDGYRQRAKIEADFFMNALDKGGTVVAFDSRNPPRDYYIDSNVYGSALKQITDYFKQHPGEEEKIRSNPELLEKFSQEFTWKNGKHNPAITKYAFAICEANILLEKYPEYRIRMDNIQALIDAGKQSGMGEDAISAAIFHTGRDQNRNSMTISGHRHIRGETDEEHKAQGTFGHHLTAMGIDNTNVMMPDSGNTNSWLELQPDMKTCRVQSPMTLIDLSKDLVVDVSKNSSQIPERDFLAYFGFESEIETARQTLKNNDVNFTCNFPETPKFDSVYKGEQANPLLNPKVKQAANNLREITKGTGASISGHSMQTNIPIIPTQGNSLRP